MSIWECAAGANRNVSVLQSSLNKLYEGQQFKQLMLSSKFSSQLIGWSKLPYLTGASIDLPFQPGIRTFPTLNHLKLLILGIGTYLSEEEANIVSKALINLEEIYTQISTVHAIRPFICNSIKMRQIYVYRMGAEWFPFHRPNNNTKYKSNLIDQLNLARMKLKNACKTIAYLPDQGYVDVKCLGIGRLNYDRVEIRRSESYVLKHPFVSSNILSKVTVDL